MRLTQKLLDITGIGKERLHVEWISSAEAQRFADIASGIVDCVKALGPLDSKAYNAELASAEMALDSETIRWLVGKDATITSTGDVYGRKWEIESYDSVLDTMLEREYHKNLIYLSIKEGCTSVRNINEQIGIGLQRISYLLADLEKTNMVEFTGMDNGKPIFAAL